MARGPSKATVAIQRLLDERQQIQTWLGRLSMAADSAPEHVRAKVRGDYERRLRELMKELQVHGGELHATVERLQGARSGLANQEREAAERVSEAELRHAVGEYDEAQWRQVHAELLGALVKIREELKHADEEIKRLDEVMTLVQAPPRAAEPTTRPPPRPTPPPKKETPAPAGGAKQADAFDELAFLRSVTEDESHGPAPGRTSGAMRAVEEPVKAKAVEPPKPDSTPRTGKSVTKSLKCKECGTMNLPTEWYCERCGAELAAL